MGLSRNRVRDGINVICTHQMTDDLGIEQVAPLFSLDFPVVIFRMVLNVKRTVWRIVPFFIPKSATVHQKNIIATYE